MKLARWTFTMLVILVIGIGGCGSEDGTQGEVGRSGGGPVHEVSQARQNHWIGSGTELMQSGSWKMLVQLNSISTSSVGGTVYRAQDMMTVLGFGGDRE